MEDLVSARLGQSIGTRSHGARFLLPAAIESRIAELFGARRVEEVRRTR